MLLSWFEKSTTSDFTVQDLIEEIKTWFTEGFLYDDVWATLREKVNNDVLPTDAEIKKMKRKICQKHALQWTVKNPVTRAIAMVVVAFVIYCKYHNSYHNDISILPFTEAMVLSIISAQKL